MEAAEYYPEGKAILRSPLNEPTAPGLSGWVDHIDGKLRTGVSSRSRPKQGPLSHREVQ